MKTIYINDLFNYRDGQLTSMSGWIKAIRKHSNLVFIDLMDSTGIIQLVVDQKRVSPEAWDVITALKKEEAILANGQISRKGENVEIHISSIQLVGAVDGFSITPRSDREPFDSERVDYLLSNRHFMIRNPEIMAIMKYRHILKQAVHTWFGSQGYTELDAPILTELPLYDDGTAVPLTLHDEELFLTQCVGFYMTAAAHAFERVYNMGPSFRREESRSKRHLMEYWHIKAEVTNANLEDGISQVESLIHYLTATLANATDPVTKWLERDINTDGMNGPFPRVTYPEVVRILNSKGDDFPFGKSLGHEDEAFLSKYFNSPLWVVGVPRAVEPFPYVIDQNDNRLTMTADLIASRGYGELLGVAEKITSLPELEERMSEKGKLNRPEYQWVRDMRNFGCVPHMGYGIGVERFLRYVLQFDHVRDGIAFPRTFGRRVYP